MLSALTSSFSFMETKAGEDRAGREWNGGFRKGPAHSLGCQGVHPLLMEKSKPDFLLCSQGSDPSLRNPGRTWQQGLLLCPLCWTALAEIQVWGLSWAFLGGSESIPGASLVLGDGQKMTWEQSEGVLKEAGHAGCDGTKLS